MAQAPQLNDSQLNLLAKIASNTGETQPKHGDGQHNLLFKIAQNTYASSGLAGSALQSSGDGYVLCQQGDDLAARYAEAKAKSPSVTNRVTLFIVPGTYSLSSELAIDAEYVDIVGLGAQFQSPAVIVTNNTLNVTANDVRVSGISVGVQSFKIGNNKPLQVFENCVGGSESFGFETIASGDFTGCKAGDSSFGRESTASGLFRDCIAANTSFGGNGTASGTFTNCTAGDGSFGGNGTASGTFTNCTTTAESFGAFGTASGVFRNCIADQNSFGYDGTLSGELISCRLIGVGAAYETPSGSGIIRFCLDGDNNIVNADAP